MRIKTMKIYPLILTLILIFFSCSATYYVKPEKSSYQELNEKLAEKKVKLEFTNGEKNYGDSIEVSTTSTFVGGKTYSTEDINKISITYHGKGALKGLGYGLIGGASFGFLMGYITHSSQTGMLVPDSPAESGLMVATVFGSIGAITGLLVGAIHGDVEDFIFLPGEESMETISVEISSIVEETETYIIIAYQNKTIRLNKSEYNSVIKTGDGKQLIVVPKSVYSRKFK